MANTQTSGTSVPPVREPFPPFASDTFASQLLWLALTFGFLYVFVAKFAAPRLASILDVRRDKITADLSSASALKGQTDAAFAAYEKALADAKANATAIAQEARKTLTAEIEAKKASIEAEMGSKLADADQRIAAMRDKAMGEVGGIAAQAAEAIVAHLASAALGKSDIETAIKSVLKS